MKRNSEEYVVYYDYGVEKFVVVLKNEYELFTTREKIRLCKSCADRVAEELNDKYKGFPPIKTKELMEFLDNVNGIIT